MNKELKCFLYKELIVLFVGILIFLATQLLLIH